MIQLRNTTYYFRQAIPKRLQPLTPRKQVYFSLRTQDRSVAELMAARLLPLVHELKLMADTPNMDRTALDALIQRFHESHSSIDSLSPKHLEGELDYLDDWMSSIGHLLTDPGTNRLSSWEYERPNGRADCDKWLTDLGYSGVSTRTRFEGDKLLHELCKTRYSQVEAALSGTILSVSPAVTGAQPPQINEASHPRLSQLTPTFIQFLHEHQRTKGTIDNYNAQLRDLVELTDDITVVEINATVADDVRNRLRKLPANRNKKPAYRDKSIDDLLKLDKITPMAESTVESYITTFKSFMAWAQRHEHANQNPFVGMPKLRSTRKESEERDPFQMDELTVLFSSDVYTNKNKPLKAYCYWLPLLGLFTGARLNELCQLQAGDISEIDNCWCLFFTDEGERQRLKNANSRRYVPLHSKLIDLGFLDYVRKRKDKRLFSDLSYSEKAGFGAYPSKWFGRYRTKLGLAPSFHSLRSNVSDAFKQADVVETKSGEIMGHRAAHSITYGRYAGSYSIAILKETIETLNFGNELSKVEKYKW
jgi:integrase